MVNLLSQQDENGKNGFEVYSFTARSFNDVSFATIFFDVWKMLGGYVIMFFYTVIMLGRLNKREVGTRESNCTDTTKIVPLRFGCTWPGSGSWRASWGWAPRSASPSCSGSSTTRPTTSCPSLP